MEATSVSNLFTEAQENGTGVRRAFSIAAILAGMFGVLGNGLVFFVMVHHPNLRKQLSSTLIANQSLVDFVSCVCLIITQSYMINPLEDHRNAFGVLICHLLANEFLLFTTLSASTYSLVLMAAERYLMITRPILHRNHFTKKKVIILAVLAWVTGALWDGVSTQVTTSVLNTTGKCRALYWDDKRAQKVFGSLYIVAVFFLPLILLIFFYSHMLFVLWRRARRVATSAINQPAPGNMAASHPTGAAHHNGLSRAQTNLTKTLLIVTLAFSLCWLPVQVWYLLYNIGVLETLAVDGYSTTVFMALLNQCINPVIYAFKYTRFQQALVTYYPLSRLVPARVANGNNSTTLASTAVTGHM